jgi:hypothetical protein
VSEEWTTHGNNALFEVQAALFDTFSGFRLNSRRRFLPRRRPAAPHISGAQGETRTRDVNLFCLVLRIRKCFADARGFA